MSHTIASHVSTTTGKPDVVVSEDEEYSKVNFDKVRSLKAAFEKDGKL